LEALLSRSIHTTRRSLEEARRFRYSSHEKRREVLQALRDELTVKRVIKQAVDEERRVGDRPVAFLPPEAIPIRARELGPYVHYPASPADLVGILRAMPPGTADGLRAIELDLAPVSPDDVDDADEEPEASKLDPFLGRLGQESIPGVYSGRTLGIYASANATIRLFGYVYDPARPNRELIDLHLRLRMLGTFVHELAHHHDAMTRIARGRWMAIDEEKVEVYAEAMQYEWVRRIVAPYIARAYPDAVQHFGAWMLRHGGVPISLETLAGDPRYTVGANGVRLFFSVESAFELLLEDVERGADVESTRLEFARSLHYGEHYEEALAALAQLLADAPGHIGARILQADIHVHQGRYAEAIGAMRRLLAESVDQDDAWEVLGDALQDEGDWAGVLDARTRAYELRRERGAEAYEVDWALAARARARLELGDYPGLLEDLVGLERDGRWRASRSAATLRAMMFLRQGHFEEALEVAMTALAVDSWGKLVELEAVRFEAARRLDRSTVAGELSPIALARLKTLGHGAWVDRLRRDFGLTA
jgi:tetratricopeptide (TPR) repeat protein